MKEKGNLLGLAFSFVTIIYILINLDWQITKETFARLDWRLIVLAFGIYLINYILRTLRFQMLLELEATSFARLFGVTNLYGMFLYLMPAKSGEVSYPILLKNQLQIPLTESTATLIAARFFDFFTVALFLPAVLITFWEKIHPWIRVGSLVFTALVLLIGISLLWFLRKFDDIAKIQTIQPDSQTGVLRIRNAMVDLFISLKTIDQRKLYWRLWLLTIAIWLCVQTNFYLIVLSLGYSLSFFQMIVVSLIMVPMTLLPLQGFANLGTHEIGWTTAFALFGFPQSTALNIAFSSHVVFLFFVLCLGLLGVLILRFLKPNAVQEQDQENC